MVEKKKKGTVAAVVKSAKKARGKKSEALVVQKEEKAALEVKNVKKSGGKKSVKVNDEDSTIIYLGHIPSGFFEPDMQKFFSQFGTVKKVKLFRSAKTGGSKGFAFIEFMDSDIARFVAEAMDGYFLSERRLVSHVIPKSKVHDGMFKYAPKKSAEEDVEDKDINMDRFRTSLRNKQKRLKDLGIDFNIEIPC